METVINRKELTEGVKTSPTSSQRSVSLLALLYIEVLGRFDFVLP